MQLAASLARDGGVGPVTLRWLVVMGFSLLMLREFFVHQWLSRHLVLYAASHMIVTPLSMLWLAQMGTGGAPLGRGVWLYAGMSFLFGFCFEIARKMKAPSQERAEVDTYTRLFGVRPVAITVAILWSLATATLVVILRGLGVDMTTPALWGGVAVLTGPALVALARFARTPTPPAAKLAEALVGLSMLMANATLVGVLLLGGGRP